MRRVSTDDNANLHVSTLFIFLVSFRRKVVTVMGAFLSIMWLSYSPFVLTRLYRRRQRLRGLSTHTQTQEDSICTSVTGLYAP